ncbi:MAG: histidine phosphatase family protein [Anaerolineales bacterium]|jgi:broad specificity phosphatase PhoE|nr:histidine phosphatase family protein [Anaerolineales bacterium]
MENFPVYDFTFLRHGQSVGNLEERFQGQADFALTETGRAQAHSLAKRWKTEGQRFGLAIASPLLRARETAEIITKRLNVPLIFDNLWLERDNGKLAGLTHAEIRLIVPDAKFYTPYESFGETGEGDWALFLRGGQAVHSLLQRPPGKYLIVSHGGLLNMVLYSILGLSPQANGQGIRFRFGNTAYARFTYQPERHRWQMEALIGTTASL